MLTTHLHVVTTLRMRGIVHLHGVVLNEAQKTLTLLARCQ
jgi:hypothetical protein